MKLFTSAMNKRQTEKTRAKRLKGKGICVN